MNDAVISDFDKLKNLLADFGVSANIRMSNSGRSLISLWGTKTDCDCDFWFDAEGNFEEVILE